MSTELQPIDRARQALQVDTRKAELAALAKESARIVEITNTAGQQECHAARVKLKNTRVEIEKRGKEAREDATAFSKAVIAAEKELVAIISPEEDRLQSVQDAWEAKLAAEKAAKAEAERQRVAAIRARIDAIKDAPRHAVGKTVADMQRAIAAVEQVDISGLAEAEEVEARVARDAAVKALREMISAAEAAAAEAARIAAERAELERQRAELAERERVAAEERAAADRAAQAERDRLAAEAQARADAEAAERRQQQEREDAERRAIEAERRAEQEREEAAARAAQAERDRIAAEQLAAERAALEAQQAELRREQEAIAEQKRLQAQAEQAAREAEEAKLRAEARAKAEEDARAAAAERARAIREATLHSAAAEAHALLCDLGQAEHITTAKLAAALARETTKEAA